jgi:carbamoyltransferase
MHRQQTKRGRSTAHRNSSGFADATRAHRSSDAPVSASRIWSFDVGAKKLSKVFFNAFKQIRAGCILIDRAGQGCFKSDQVGSSFVRIDVIGEGKKITPVAKSYYPASLGHYYASVTKWLGFKANRHEGKILGLAAYGNPNSPAYEMVKDILDCDGLTIKAPFMIGKLWHHKAKILKKN